MTGDTAKDKKLIENLDRILAGRESDISEPMDEDTRTALDFARKMASLGETPSEEFAGSLKADLVHKLEEQRKQQNSEDQTLLLWGMPRRKLWQGTIAAVITLIIAAVILLVVLLLNSN